MRPACAPHEVFSNGEVTAVLEEMKRLAMGKTICVLATTAGNRPYCSLMAYATNEECTEIYMATHRSTRKFRNLVGNPAVSLMIDEREALPRTRACALTVEGDCAPVEEPDRQRRIRERLLAVHPHLAEFLAHPDSAVLCVRLKSFLLLKGLSEAHHAELP
jgi:nitroimidazol reductase NimA-like FMN-containing flavoprotein (pyridoxamine 5'-phosphate oxidase superfamily)